MTSMPVSAGICLQHWTSGLVLGPASVGGPDSLVAFPGALFSSSLPFLKKLWAHSVAQQARILSSPTLVLDGLGMLLPRGSVSALGACFTSSEPD